MKLTVTLEAHQQSIKLEELIEKYIEKVEKPYKPTSFEEMVHYQISPLEIRNREKRENSIREMFKSHRASGRLIVTTINGNEVVSIDALITWAGDEVFLDQKKIRNRKTFLEIADEKWTKLQLAKEEENAKESLSSPEVKTGTHNIAPTQVSIEVSNSEKTTQSYEGVLSEFEQDPNDSALRRREKQIRLIELAAVELNYNIFSLPLGTKKELMAWCKEKAPRLFGAGDHSFIGAWKAARKQGRVKTENHQRYISK